MAGVVAWRGVLCLYNGDKMAQRAAWRRSRGALPLLGRGAERVKDGGCRECRTRRLLLHTFCLPFIPAFCLPPAAAYPAPTPLLYAHNRTCLVPSSCLPQLHFLHRRSGAGCGHGRFCSTCVDLLTYASPSAAPSLLFCAFASPDMDWEDWDERAPPFYYHTLPTPSSRSAGLFFSAARRVLTAELVGLLNACRCWA